MLPSGRLHAIGHIFRQLTLPCKHPYNLGVWSKPGQLQLCGLSLACTIQWGLPGEVQCWRTAATQSVHITYTWWRHQIETFSALLALCAGNSPVSGEFPAQRPVTRSFDVFFDLGLNKRLSKQSKRWWFETPSCSLWRHRNENDQAGSPIVHNFFLMWAHWPVKLCMPAPYVPPTIL